MNLRNLHLGTLIPVLVILLMLPFGSAVIILSYIDANTNLAHTATQAFNDKLSNLSIELSRLSRKDDSKGMQRIISLAGANASLSHLSLIDKGGTILYSTRFAWRGLKAKDTIDEFNPAIFNTLQNKQLKDFSNDSKQHHIHAYYTVEINNPSPSSANNYAVLYGKFTYSAQAQDLWHKQLQKLSAFLFGLVLFSLFLIIILRRWFHKPLQEIFHFINLIEQGKEAGEINVKASKDISHLASALENMNKSLQQSQKSLAQTYSLLENLLDSVPDLIFYKNKKGIYLGCNQAFCDLVGESSIDNIVGMTDFDLFDKELAESLVQKDHLMLASGKQQQHEDSVTYPDGRKVLLSTLQTPYYDENKEIIGTIGISRNITATKELEEQFNQAQKMEAIGTLVGGIAHDFNNVLAGITGNLYLAKKKLVDHPNATKKLVTIETLSFRAADMIKQLLTFARKDTVRIQDLSLTSFIKEAMKLLHTSVPENIAFQEQLCTYPLFIKGDVTQLQQVLMNLINNARDAVEDIENPRITISLESFLPSHGFMKQHPDAVKQSYAHISIQDNGCGIPKDELEHIFEPFFTTKPPGKGTGLGLSMVFGAVKTHQGILDIESIEGDGSTFHLYIPQLPAKDFTLTVPKGIKHTKAHGEFILLVDDEQYVRETGAEVLETFGYKVLQAEDGLQAIDIFKKHQHDIAIIILDVVMPNLGGVEAAAHIRMINPNIPVIFVTGYDKEQMLKLGNQASNSSVIGKPIDFDKLHHIISEKITS